MAWCMIRRATCAHFVQIGSTSTRARIIYRGTFCGFENCPLSSELIGQHRHVRVHHVDRDKDDPQLREVLAQRPEGPSRGRRRRGAPS